MGIFSKKENFSFTFYISLKSSSIDVQLVKLYSDQKREVLLCERNILFLKNSQDPTLYNKTYVTELENLFKKYQIQIFKLTGGLEFSVQFILHAPWFTTQFDTLF